MLYSPLAPQTTFPHMRYDSYLDLQEKVGSHTFAQSVRQSLCAAAGVDEFMIFVRPQASATPCVVASEGEGERVRKRADAYCARYFRFDPLCRVLERGADRTVYVARVRCEDIANREYRRLCYAEPHFSEKLSFLQKTAQGWIVLSLFRRDSAGRFSDDDIEALSGVGLLLMPIVGAHCRNTKIGRERAQLSIADIEMRIRSTFPSLSSRESAVCARTLAGVTAEGTAIDLGIKQTSVLTYRRRAYERLNISTAHQLSTMLL